MWRNFFQYIVVLSFAGMLSGCGALPKPFAHERPVISNPLISLAGGGAIRVETDPDLPESLAKPLTENMIKSLWAENVPASDDTSFRPRYILRGQLKIAYPSVFDPEEAEIIWTLMDAYGNKLDAFDLRIAGDRAGWLFLDQELLADLSANAGKEVVRLLYAQGKSGRTALSIPEPPQSKVKITPDSVILAQKPKIFLAKIIGATGDGNISLHRNLQRLLKIAGAELVSERPKSVFLVKGFVNISPPYGGSNDVAITWLVTTKDGKELGKITQNNKVPVGVLAGRWGEIAHIITQGASIGIFDVIEQQNAPIDNKKPLLVPG
ncbi:MAG: hypothetical protein HN731_12585 [Rhodospirillaceae bacterium]|nr:hypothetical protein [Rhodospirillaceae bacterium]